MSVLLPERQDARDGEKFQEIHVSRWPSLEVALCGEPRNGRPSKPGAEVTCVVCRALSGRPV